MSRLNTPPRQRSGVLRSVCLCVCLSVCPREYLWNRWTDLHEFFLRGSSVAMARSSSGGVAISYVFPVLCMTSRLALMGRMALHGRLTSNLAPLAALRYWGGIWCLRVRCCSCICLDSTTGRLYLQPFSSVTQNAENVDLSDICRDCTGSMHLVTRSVGTNLYM